MDEIVKLILDSCDQLDGDCIEGTMAQKLLDMAKRATEVKPEFGHDDETVEKILFLKKCEDKHDLGWMDWSSWNALSYNFKLKFEEVVNPLMWQGVYFQLSRFKDNKQILTLLDTSHSINVMEKGNAFRFVCMNSNSSVYDFMGPMALETLRKDFMAHICMAMGVSSKGEVVIKYYNKDKDEHDDKKDGIEISDDSK